MSSPLEHEEPQRAAGQGPGDNLRGVFSPVDLLTRGKEAESIAQGTLESAGAWTAFFDVLASAVHSTECKRSPE